MTHIAEEQLPSQERLPWGLLQSEQVVSVWISWKWLWIFPSSDEGWETPTLLYPLKKGNQVNEVILSNGTQQSQCPEGGNTSSFQNVLSVISRILGEGQKHSSIVVKGLCYKPEGCGFETRWDKYIFAIYLILLPARGPGVHLASNTN
jgi:hypothetical protein